MSEYNLGGALELDASDFVSNASDAADASGEFDESAEETQETLFEFDAAGAAASAGIAAAGGAMQGALDSSKEWRSSLGLTAESTEMTRDETEELAASLSDATFPMDDAVTTMDQLAQLGVDSAEEMEGAANAADLIADATGTSATSVSENLAPAVNALDGDLDALEDSADAFVTAARDSDMSVEDLGSTMERLDYSQLEEMGLQSEDTAGLIAEFAEETGYSGRVLRSEFGSAVEDADGDLGQLTEELGLGDDALDSWNQRLEENEGVAKRHAEAANDSVTTMDRLHARFDDVKLAAGGLLEPIDALAPVLMAAGSAGMVLSTVNMSAVIPSLAGVMTTLTPILPILLGLGAAAAVLYGAWETNFLDIQGVTDSVIGAATGYLDDLKSYLEDVVPPILDAFGDLVEATFGRLEDAIEAAIDVATPVLETFFGYLESAHATHIQPLESDFVETWDVVRGRIQSFVEWSIPYVETFLEALRSLFDVYVAIYAALWDAFGESIISVAEFAFNTVRTVVEQLLDGITTTIEVALAVIRGDWEGAWDAVAGYFDRTWDRIAGILDDYVGTMTDVFSGFIGGIQDLALGLLDWFGADWDLVGTIVGVLEDVRERAVGIAGEIFDGIVSALSGVGEAIGDSVREGFNQVVPSDVELPSMEVGGQSISVEIAGQEVGGTLPSETVGGGSLDLPQLNTGGYIEDEGPAYLHEGEQVVQSAQVSNRGEVEAGADAEEVAAALEDVSRDDEIVALLERLLAAIKALEVGDVSQKDILRALDVARDRRGGRNPLGGD